MDIISQRNKAKSRGERLTEGKRTADIGPMTRNSDDAAHFPELAQREGIGHAGDKIRDPEQPVIFIARGCLAIGQPPVAAISQSRLAS